MGCARSHVISLGEDQVSSCPSCISPLSSSSLLPLHYHFELTAVSSSPVRGGPGPRHFWQQFSGRYCFLHAIFKARFACGRVFFAAFLGLNPLSPPPPSLCCCCFFFFTLFILYKLRGPIVPLRINPYVFGESFAMVHVLQIFIVVRSSPVRNDFMTVPILNVSYFIFS